MDDVDYVRILLTEVEEFINPVLGHTRWGGSQKFRELQHGYLLGRKPCITEVLAQLLG